MPTTSTSDTDPAIGRYLALSRLRRQGRDLFQGEAMALARAGIFGDEQVSRLQKLLVGWQATVMDWNERSRKISEFP